MSGHGVVGVCQCGRCKCHCTGTAEGANRQQHFLFFVSLAVALVPFLRIAPTEVAELFANGKCC